MTRESAKLCVIGLLIGLWMTSAGCQAADESGDGADADGDSDADSDSDADGDSDSDSDTDPGNTGNLHGTVVSASGFPISGALVYVTMGDGPEIPDAAYCYVCDDMTGKKWTLTDADGTWTLESVTAGTTNLVTRKGGFQRQREITVTGDAVQDVPQEYTTLPGEPSDDGLDQIPNYAVLLNVFDHPEDLLAKMGLGDLDAGGHLIQGTESFDLYNDAVSGTSSVGPASSLFASQETLNHYHMVFFPCMCGMLNHNSYLEMLQQYISAGGKTYGSCLSGHWIEAPLPDVIDFYGTDNMSSPGSYGFYETVANINDEEMRNWLGVVAPAQDPWAYPFVEIYTKIDGLSFDSYDGHGVLDDGTIGGPVQPVAWATDDQQFPGAPLTVTYNYDCGKAFYSTYHVTMSTSSAIQPQEWVLIYLFYEIGVCEGEYIPPE